MPHSGRFVRRLTDRHATIVFGLKSEFEHKFMIAFFDPQSIVAVVTMQVADVGRVAAQSVLDHSQAQVRMLLTKFLQEASSDSR